MKADVNILVLLNLQAPSHNVVSDLFYQSGMDFVTEISFCKTPVVNEKNIYFSNRERFKVS